MGVDVNIPLGNGDLQTPRPMTSDERLLLASRIAHEMYGLFRGSDSGVETIVQATRWIDSEIAATMDQPAVAVDVPPLRVYASMPGDIGNFD
jgi:hypothetical protein